MNEMVELVARAIYRRMPEVALRVDGTPSEFDELVEESRNLWLQLARAAIEAMRDPTEDMVMAGVHKITWMSAYRAMIDAALKE